ncbi:DUF4224 domain-containing protein [Variovorax sp. PAMC 28711]|uniref:DUF4224 domain-containing protein n=1 Tax=Variovorax sp. PAMC 28711 TaxID=1795631 RepID=UPI00078C02AD|nr:DUF4224 domain-containing protein [Variovorax sp. PAMC 28711]AMM23208.1 hypothetical protein AX767_01560 [Variovorax sp. PAMC 28711]
MSLFLNAEDIAELTGIRAGKDGKSREERQIATLRQMKIPHYVNAVGRPVVARAVIEGTGAQPAPILSWEPRLAHG